MLDQFQSRASHEMVKRGFGHVIGECAFESHRSMTRRADHHSPFTTRGYHLMGRFLNDLEIGQDVDIKRSLDQREVRLKKIPCSFPGRPRCTPEDRADRSGGFVPACPRPLRVHPNRLCIIPRRNLPCEIGQAPLGQLAHFGRSSNKPRRPAAPTAWRSARIGQGRRNRTAGNKSPLPLKFRIGGTHGNRCFFIFTSVSEGSSLCQTRRTTEGKGLSLSARPEGKGWSLRLPCRRAKAGAFAYSAEGQRLEPSLTLLPQPPDEILKLPLVVLYGGNRHIHKSFHHPQIRDLRNVGLALHRIQGNQ